MAEDPQWVYIAFGLVETTCAIIGAPGSAIILSYFILKLKSKDRSASTFLYIWISLVDVIICLLSFSSAVSDFNLGEAAMFGNKYFCHIAGFLSNVSRNMSVFMIAVLSIARTVSITFIFLKVTCSHVAIPVIIYLFILVIQSSLPFVFITDSGTGGYSYNEGYSYCAFSIDQVFELESLPHKIFTNWVTVGNTILPLPIILISCCVTVYQLSAGRSEIRNAEGEKTKREATITILIITGIYIVFNTPLCFIWIMDLPWMPEDWLKWVVKLFGDNLLIYIKLITFTSIGLNSLFNVVVYFCRLKGLRQHVRDMIRSTKELLKRNTRDASELILKCFRNQEQDINCSGQKTTTKKKYKRGESTVRNCDETLQTETFICIDSD